MSMTDLVKKIWFYKEYIDSVFPPYQYLATPFPIGGLSIYLALFVTVAPVEVITEQKRTKLTAMGHFFLISKLTMVTKKMLDN